MSSDGRMNQILNTRNRVVDTAVEYIKLRDSLNSHSSPEGKKLNDAVKAYLAALK